MLRKNWQKGRLPSVSRGDIIRSPGGDDLLVRGFQCGGDRDLTGVRATTVRCADVLFAQLGHHRPVATGSTMGRPIARNPPALRGYFEAGTV